MKIHRVELRHVRHIRELSLDLSAPLTVIGGANGVGKSTLQKSILLALFHGKKEARDELVSLYDPHTPPQAILHLSEGGPTPTIVLSRSLLDDKGEWSEGNVTVKKKGEALKKVQDKLPINADTAALVLWGLQEELAGVVSEFPADGHTMLTQASIKGAGPDPKKLIQELEKESNKARQRGDKEPGSLTRAERDVERLDTELKTAREAETAREQLKARYESARAAFAQAERRRDQLKAEVQRLAGRLQLIDDCLKVANQAATLEKSQQEWGRQETEIARLGKDLEALAGEVAALQTELRAARDRELASRIDKLQIQLDAVACADGQRAEADKELTARPRPEEKDETFRRALQAASDRDENKMQATGVRYVLVSEEPRSVLVSEDGAPPRKIELAPGQPHQGVVGGIAVQAGDLRLEAVGKEDIAGLKLSIEKSRASLAELFARFGVRDDRAFDDALTERKRLEQALKRAEQAVRDELKGATLTQLQGDLRLAEKERNDNAVTQKDVDCLGKPPRSVPDVREALAGKNQEIALAQRTLKNLQDRLPAPAERARLHEEWQTLRRRAEENLARCQEADPRSPTADLLSDVKKTLESKYHEQNDVEEEYDEADKQVVRLAENLKYAGPGRPPATIETDLAAARDILQREQVLQEARGLLKQRIEDKIEELTASVPQELASRIGAHLARMTRGAFAGAKLDSNFLLASVAENGSAAMPWEPRRLSTGERHQAALALKIAVARSLAEMRGAVFIILDESLAAFDPARRAATEDLLLDLVADGKLQVIYLTCQTDWAEDWQRRKPGAFRYIELSKHASYYRLPAALAANAGREP